MYLEMAFERSVADKELPYPYCFKWRNPVYPPEPEEFAEPLFKNDVFEYYPDPDLYLLAPVPRGAARLHGLFKYTKMEKVLRRRLTLPTRLEITADDRQMVKNYQQQYRTENTLLRQLRTAGLEGASLLKSNALAVSFFETLCKFCINFFSLVQHV